MAPAEHERLLRAATRASVVVAFSLIGLKAAAAWITGSAAVFGALLDSSIDALASGVTFVAVRQALVPADREHRFGHGKAEQLAGLAQATFIVASAALLAWRAVEALRRPQPATAPWLSVAVMAVAIVLTGVLVAFQRRVVAVTHSSAIRADLLHYSGDLLLHGSVLAGVIAWEWLAWDWLDGALALAISAWLVVSAGRVGWESLQTLMDHELPEEERARIRACVVAHPQVRGMHDLRTRLSGSKRLIQLHLELDGDLALRDAHRITEEVAVAIRGVVPGSEVLIHEDPVGLEEAEDLETE